MLWFASNLLFLHYQSQLQGLFHALRIGCDLLRIYYFCTINHSPRESKKILSRVVICFEFIIFALSITAFNTLDNNLVVLWFASNLLFLHYQSQPPKRSEKLLRGCDLLRIYYFCTINHSAQSVLAMKKAVVICFEFIIFALSITAI